jgi:hypothetical protein
MQRNDMRYRDTTISHKAGRTTDALQAAPHLYPLPNAPDAYSPSFGLFHAHYDADRLYTVSNNLTPTTPTTYNHSVLFQEYPIMDIMLIFKWLFKIGVGLTLGGVAEAPPPSPSLQSLPPLHTPTSTHALKKDVPSFIVSSSSLHQVGRYSFG